MNNAKLNATQLEKLSRVDSPTIANVIELFDIRSYVAGYTNLALKAIYPELPPAVGHAVTATFRAAYPSNSADSYGGMTELIAEFTSIPEPRIIVFQDLDDPPQAATYGELMATTFMKFGFSGLITSGAARDIEQVRRLKFPCWASSVIVSHGYCRFLDFNVPVHVGGLQVKPGDLLHADANGIVSIPDPISAAVADLCEPYMQAENVILEYLRTSKPTAEGYHEAFSRAKLRMTELRAQAGAFLLKAKS
ncbi:MAG: RraA family protein [Acidobacteria bacterium]|nr:RraA family protein [Acidobacteriota bacterium]MCI0620373.1 RraA family protein [Acidobacteriota bacterium]MCI0724126.1 RraA family protein [Acidobacteriota bacterium]